MTVPPSVVTAARTGPSGVGESARSTLVRPGLHATGLGDGEPLLAPLPDDDEDDEDEDAPSSPPFGLPDDEEEEDAVVEWRRLGVSESDSDSQAATARTAKQEAIRCVAV